MLEGTIKSSPKRFCFPKKLPPQCAIPRGMCNIELGSTGHGKPGKSWNFTFAFVMSWKSWKRFNLFWKSCNFNCFKCLYVTDFIQAAILSLKIREYIVSLERSWKSHGMLAVKVMESHGIIFERKCKNSAEGIPFKTCLERLTHCRHTSNLWHTFQGISITWRCKQTVWSHISTLYIQMKHMAICGRIYTQTQVEPDRSVYLFIFHDYFGSTMV